MRPRLPRPRLTAALLALAALLAVLAAPVQAQPTPKPPKPCSNQLRPPPPVDTSENPPPGQTAPRPLPVPDEPVGGPRMGECRLVLPDGAPLPPRGLKAASWLLADLDSGQVLAAKDPHGRQRPASLIKVLLAMVVLDELEPEQIVVANRQDAKQECTCIGIRRGQRYTVDDLFTGLLISSGNDAAHTLGSALGGIDAALAKMNTLAKRLGALDTRAATTSGLDGPGMSSSAYDIALIFRAALQRPRFAEAIRTQQLRFTYHRRKPPITLINDNKLLDSYRGFLGGKTGFTDDSRHTYVGAADRGGRRLVVVLMRAEQRPVRVSKQAQRLLDYGFALADAGPQPVGELVRRAAAAPAGPAAAGDSDTPGALGSPPGGDQGNTAVVLALLIAAVALLGGYALRRKPR